MEPQEEMSVAVIGTGTVGATLARAFAAGGCAVVVGSRQPDGDAAGGLVAQLGANSRAAAPGAAIEHCPLAVVALPGPAMASFVDEHAHVLAGKVVVDATNDLTHGHAPAGLSSVPLVRRRVPTALVYRAFNSIGVENVADPQFGDEVADLFYAGPAQPERDLVESLIATVGLRPIWVGESDDAHAAVDALATLWFSLALTQGRGRRIAFRMLDADDERPASDAST